MCFLSIFQQTWGPKMSNNTYNKNNNIYNTNNNIFGMNTLNYKRKNNIYNTHYYINIHVVECGRV
jgi:hypothetical protein